MSLNEFEIIKELGKGAFGSVCKVKRKACGNIYAMKRVKISQLNPKERDNALNEVRILASLTHTNIIGYKQAFFDEDSKTLNIVMELADDGDLESKIQGHIKSKTNMPESAVWSYLIQMTSGLKALHDNKIMHRDLKCANIFLMKDGTLKLGDLNVSKVVKMQLAYTQTGTPYYASPEVWSDKPYDYKSDLWSVGAVIYELCTLKPPFKGTSLQELYRNIMRGDNNLLIIGVYDPIPKMYSKELSTVISNILQVNPNNRPNCDQVLNNPLVVKRLDFGKNFGKAQVNLIGTIKMPRNMNEINKNLPKGQFNNPGEFLVKKNSEENLHKIQTDPLNNEVKSNKKNEFNHINGNNNLIEEKKNQALNRPVSVRHLPPNNSEPVKNQISSNNNGKQMPHPIYNNQVNNKAGYIPSNNKNIISNNKVVNRPISSNNPVQIKPSINSNQYKKPNILISNPVKGIIANKQNKYESPLIQKNNPQQKMIINRPISSKVDQKILAANNQLKKMPEPRVIGNQIKISEKLIKNNQNNLLKNYGQNNVANYKQQPVRNGPKIINIKK